MVDVIVAGHLCVDLIPDISERAATSESFLVPGRLTEVGALTLATGGCVSNTGLAFHRLGMDVRLVARIGADAIGSLTRDLLCMHGEQLVEHLSVISGETSSYTLVINPPDTDRSFLHCPGTNNTFGPEDIPHQLLTQARLFHLGYPPLMRRMYEENGKELLRIFRRAKHQDLTTSLDMAMPDPSQPSGKADWQSILEQVLPFVDIFMPSVEELLYMLRRKDYDKLSHAKPPLIEALTPDLICALAEDTLALGARMVALKLGHRGLYLRTAPSLSHIGKGRPIDVETWEGRELWSPCFRVHVIGTTGAGDATIAGFLTGLLLGQDAEAAMTSAVAVGACNVEQADATSGLRSWKETQARIRAGWSRRDAQISGDDWSWDERRGIWHGPHDRSPISLHYRRTEGT